MELDWVAIGGAVGGVGFGLFGAYKAFRASHKADKNEKRLVSVETFAADGGETLKEGVKTALSGQAELRMYMHEALAAMNKSLNEAQQERDYVNRELEKLRIEQTEKNKQNQKLIERVQDLEYRLTRANNEIITLNAQRDEMLVTIKNLERRLETGEFKRGGGI